MELPKDKTVGNPHVAFDSTGMVFAVMAQQASRDGHYIHLYDARNFTGGAFSEMSVATSSMQQAMTAHGLPSNDNSNDITLNKIDFNGSGNRMLVQSDQGLAFVLDGYEGTVQRVFAPSNGSSGTVSCFTSDDQSVLLGSESGTLQCYDIESGALVKQLEGHTGRVNAIACNPKYKQVASSCSSTW
jgi:WD40 repeat protein